MTASVVLAAVGLGVVLIGIDRLIEARRRYRRALRDVARRERQVALMAEEIGADLRGWLTLYHDVSTENALLAAEVLEWRASRTSVAPAPVAVRVDADGRLVSSYIQLN